MPSGANTVLGVMTIFRADGQIILIAMTHYVSMKEPAQLEATTVMYCREHWRWLCCLE